LITSGAGASRLARARTWVQDRGPLALEEARKRGASATFAAWKGGGPNRGGEKRRERRGTARVDTSTSL
jgi:hypothetical protein